MSSAISTDTARLSRAGLRLVRGERAHRFGRDARRVDDAGTSARGLAGKVEGTLESVLVAGADASKRERMLGELRGLLPGDTPFVEARETWEVLAKAPETRMVVLTGDLGDISAAGLMRVLSRRHPMLPVIALGERTRASAPGGLGAASL